MRKAIVSAAFGWKYSRISSVTYPTQKGYAQRVGADFIALSVRKFQPPATPHWEKLQLGDLLNEYDRLLWLDSDVIVRSDAPDLFQIVPEGLLGASDESISGYWDYPGMFRTWITHSRMPEVGYPGWYFNSGVMVVSREHAGVFASPPVYGGPKVLWEQTYLNYKAAALGARFMDLTSAFNHIFISPGSRWDSHFIHYCGLLCGMGFARDMRPNESYAEFIAREIEFWEAKKRSSPCSPASTPTP